MPHARAAVDFFNTTAFGWHVGLMLLSARCLIVVSTGEYELHLSAHTAYWCLLPFRRGSCSAAELDQGMAELDQDQYSTSIYGCREASTQDNIHYVSNRQTTVPTRRLTSFYC